jgi:hypothetical protein
MSRHREQLRVNTVVLSIIRVFIAKKAYLATDKVQLIFGVGFAESLVTKTQIVNVANIVTKDPSRVSVWNFSVTC